MKKVVDIEARDKKEALELAKIELSKVLEQDEIDLSNVSIDLIKKKKRLLLFNSKKNIYKVSYEDTISKEDEKFLDLAMDSIDIDGELAIKLVDDGIFIKITEAQGKGKKITYSNVKALIDEKEIVEVDWHSVKEIIENAEDKWELIAPRKKELDRDAEINIQVSDDKLKAYLSYIPSLGGKEINLRDLNEFLSENGISVGIKEEKLNKIIENKEKAEGVLIAEGIEPVPGKDAQLIYHFEEKKESIGTEREDGSIDYFDLALITNVQPGDVLLTKKDSEAGKAGKAVTGEEIKPAIPKDVKILKGKNTELKDEYTLIAKEAGQVVLNERGNVEVLPVYEVRGDVDLSTGNIDFVGNVKVNGNVTEGFKIRADGNVEVRGNVSIADIEAGGNVVVSHGFVGKNKSSIKAKGDVKIKFVENATVKSEKSIYVSDAVMHSKLTAADSIEVIKKKGLLVGGVVKAGKKIIANTIGSALATTTHLEAGVDPEIRNKINNLKEEIKKDSNNLTKSTKALKILEKLKESNNGLPEEKVIMYYQLQKTVKQLQSMKDEKENNISALKEKLKISENGFVQAKKKLYPGVKIIIGNSQLNIYNETAASKFLEQEGEITQLNLRG
ncbi:DUF342 domain-containing protein [Natronospora cellulosivora (SeqCode)]